MMISGLFNVGLITRYVYLWAIWIQRFHHVSFHKFWHAINVKAMKWSTSDNMHGRAVLCEVLNQTKHQLCRGSNFNWTTDARPEVKYELVTEAGTRSLDSRLLSYLLSMAKMVIFDNDDKRDRQDEKLLRFCDRGADIQVHGWKNVARSTTSTLMQYHFLFWQNQWWVENLNRYNNDDKHDDGDCSHTNHNDENHYWCKVPFPRLF